MLFTIVRSIIFGFGLLCLHVDIGSRLFGSYARTTRGMLCRMVIVIFAEVIYSLPFLAILVIPDNNWATFLNTFIFILGILAIAFFLFPIHFGIRSGNHVLTNNKTQEHDLIPSVVLHEESIQIDYPICVNNLELLILSDLHCNSQRHFEVIQESINKLKFSKFDIVLILGDLTEDKKYLRLLFQLFEEIDAQHGKFLVRGNHDYEGGRLSLVEKLAQEFAITLLNNKSSYIEKLELTLIGTEKPWCKAVMTPEISGLSIGLSHTPDNIKLFSQIKTPLVLAGHTHGGKIKVPLIGSILVPSLYGRFLDYGWFNHRKTSMFITKGFGYFPGRLGSKGEILKLHINGKTNSVEND